MGGVDRASRGWGVFLRATSDPGCAKSSCSGVDPALSSVARLGVSGATVYERKDTNSSSKSNRDSNPLNIRSRQSNAAVPLQGRFV